MMTGIPSQETLLLIDDDSAVRTMLRRILENSGYLVIEAVDGEDGVDAFKNNIHSIKLIISDVVMPKKNGKHVYDEVRQIREDLKILFISGYTADILDNKIEQDERTEFMQKPLRPDSFLTKIRGILDS